MTNPFAEDGVFKVILLEMPQSLSAEETAAEAAKKKKRQQQQRKKGGKLEEETPKSPDPGMNAAFIRSIDLSIIYSFINLGNFSLIHSLIFSSIRSYIRFSLQAH